MNRQQKIKLLQEIKEGKHTYKEIIHRTELPDCIIFIGGVTEINGEKITIKEFYKRFPDEAPPIDISLHLGHDRSYH